MKIFLFHINSILESVRKQNIRIQGSTKIWNNNYAVSVAKRKSNPHVSFRTEKQGLNIIKIQILIPKQIT